MRYYIIGDTGGHLSVLQKGLEDLGVDMGNHRLPADVTIIHLGDLLHKGPSGGRKMLNFVNTMQTHSPNRWIQLIGNHEFQHMGGEKFWNCNCEPEVGLILADMVSKKNLSVSWYVKNLIPANMTRSKRDTNVPKTSDWLFTHGGLTQHWWNYHHNGETDVRTLSKSINRLDIELLDAAGSRMGYPLRQASPIWASAGDEVFSSWKEKMPFNQALGHTYLFNWEAKRWFGNPPIALRRAFKQNEFDRVSIANIGDSIMVVADPGFESREPVIDSQPVVFIGETV